MTIVGAPFAVVWKTYTINTLHHKNNYCIPTLAPAKGLLLHSGLYNHDNDQTILLKMEKKVWKFIICLLKIH